MCIFTSIGAMSLKTMCLQGLEFLRGDRGEPDRSAQTSSPQAHVQLVEYYTDLLKFAQICSHPKKSVWWHMRGWRACPSPVAPSATPVAGLCANACLAGLGSYNHYLGTGLRSTTHFLWWGKGVSAPFSCEVFYWSHVYMRSGDLVLAFYVLSFWAGMKWF